MLFLRFEVLFNKVIQHAVHSVNNYCCKETCLKQFEAHFATTKPMITPPNFQTKLALDASKPVGDYRGI